MIDEETNESVESKIQEIERLVAEVVDTCDKHCRTVNSCVGCRLKTSVVDETDVRRWMCNKITRILE